MKATLKKHIINVRGNRLKQKYIVFESDDWGGIRIPDISIREALFQRGLTRASDPFSQFDSLETTEDYQMLFNVLNKFKDNNGQHPILTANFILNNPNFEKIASEDFQHYYNESFEQTYKRYSGSEKARTVLDEGIDDKFIVPQYHGSEHLNVVRWMKYLKSGNEPYRYAFEKNCFAIDETDNYGRRHNLMAAYDYNNTAEFEFIKNSIKQGLNQFKNIFGFKSLTSIAPCYVWNHQVEQEMLEGGVKGFQGSFLQNCPIPEKSFKKKYRYIGQKNKDKQFYFVRNGLFEPSLIPNIDWVSKCMESIDIAFKWGKPAIIGTHRINFSGRLDSKQRDQNLKMFEQLLFKIIQKWKDVQFISTNKLLKNYTDDKNS